MIDPARFSRVAGLSVLVPPIAAFLVAACIGDREGPADSAEGLQPSEVAPVDTAAGGGPISGWLGFSTVEPGGQPTNPWLPSHPSAEVVVFTDAWPGASGSGLLAVAYGYADTVRFAGVTEVPYGCDGVPTSMAAFDGTRIAPEGPVWLAPLGSAVEAAPLERSGSDASGGLSWRAGRATVTLSPIAASRARLSLEVDGVSGWSGEYETYSMGEEEPPPIDVDGFTPGIPIPVAAFHDPATRLPLVVLLREGYEGNAFDLLRADLEPPVFDEGDPIYFCAY